MGFVMPQEMWALTLSAALIAFSHTLLGPDHYLPFIAMAKSGDWTQRKTIWVTCLCGLGHVLSSVVLGLVGIALGATLARLSGVEAWRGELAAWGLIAFGMLYMLWGLRRGLRGQVHSHTHVDGSVHRHVHRHQGEHSHSPAEGQKMTPYVLFIIFVLGPCEPLIPLMMYPAARDFVNGAWVVAGVFAGVTIATMLGVVLLALRGLQRVPSAKLGRYVHAQAGATIMLSGMAIQFLGL